MSREMTVIQTLTAVLFAGGESRRMGADKATLTIAGKPLWSRQLDTLRELCPWKLLISVRNRPTWAPADVEVVRDAPPSRGPLSGFAAALRQIQSTHLLALAIDLPEMTTEHLLRIWESARPGVGVVPQCGERYEPLAAIYPATAESNAARALAMNRLSLRSLIEDLLEQQKIGIYPVNDDEKRLYRNVNSPDDLR